MVRSRRTLDTRRARCLAPRATSETGRSLPARRSTCTRATRLGMYYLLHSTGSVRPSDQPAWPAPRGSPTNEPWTAAPRWTSRLRRPGREAMATGVMSSLVLTPHRTIRDHPAQRYRGNGLRAESDYVSADQRRLTRLPSRRSTRTAQRSMSRIPSATASSTIASKPRARRRSS